MVDYDVILKDLGSMATSQKVQLAILWLPGLLAAMHMAGMMFLGYNQEHVCNMPQQQQITKECNITWSEQLTERYIPRNEETQSLDECTRYKIDHINCTYWAQNDSETLTSMESEQCDGWTYDTTIFTSTIVSEFNLVCGGKQKRRLSQAIFMMGVVLGTTLWGQISDRFGRKIAVMLPMVIGVGVGIATAYANSFLEFTIMRFFIGICIFPSFSCCYVLSAETVQEKHKVWIGQTFQAIFGIGICILPGLAYFVRYWRAFQLCISVPGVLVILLLWYVVESPRWLISSGKFIRANRIIKRYMESLNSRSHEAKKLEALSDLQRKKGTARVDTANLIEDGKTKVKATGCPKETVVAIWKLPNMRRKSFLLYYEWMVTSVVYYGITLNAAEVGGNPYIGATISALMEIPSSYLAIPMMQKWGRRPSLVSSLFVAGFACACMMFVPEDVVWLNVTLSTLGKFSISMTFGVVYIYAADIYPTPVRNVGIGVCSSMARIGGMLAPFIAMLDVIGFAVPYVAFGLLALLGGFLGLLLPETLGRKLPETLDEAEQFGKHYEGIMARICGGKDSDSIAEEAILDETKA